MLTRLEPLDWFDEGQHDGNFLWCPPPAAANVVVYQLREARHKRPHCLHPHCCVATINDRKLVGGNDEEIKYTRTDNSCQIKRLGDLAAQTLTHAHLVSLVHTPSLESQDSRALR
jgi:hypothetical protein